MSHVRGRTTREKAWLCAAGVLWLVLLAAGWLAACVPAAVDPGENTVLPNAAPVQETTIPSLSPTPAVSPSSTPAVAMATPALIPTFTPRPTAQLLGTFPVDGDEGVPLDAPLALRFDQPVEAEWVRAHLAVSPAVQGTIEQLDPTTVVFRTKGWQAETWYTMRWNASPQDSVEIRFATFPDGRVPLPILMYHRLVELPADAGASTREWTTAPANFRAHIQFLIHHGYHVVPLEALLDYLEHHTPLPPHPAAITFDDGYRDFVEVAWPALREAGMPATVFLIPSHMGYGAFLTWEQVAALAKEGVTFGSHTLAHVRLKGLEAEELRRQLLNSRTVLEERLGVSVSVVSYPYGAWDSQVVQAAEEAGYRAGVTINPSRYQRRSGIFTLSRLHLPYDAAPEDWADWLTR
ncbi:MAG: polysaccharide deacetylase family protein [Anaerolineae bacterium]